MKLQAQPTTWLWTVLLLSLMAYRWLWRQPIWFWIDHGIVERRGLSKDVASLEFSFSPIPQELWSMNRVTGLVHSEARCWPISPYAGTVYRLLEMEVGVRLLPLGPEQISGETAAVSHHQWAVTASKRGYRPGNGDTGRVPSQTANLDELIWPPFLMPELTLFHL